MVRAHLKRILVTVADLGRIRAGRVDQGQSDWQPRLELVDELRPEAPHQEMADLTTTNPTESMNHFLL